MSKDRLLLIEDDFDVAEMLLMYFQSHDYELLHADTGAEGIELARKAFPTVIILDLMLPDMDGYEIFTQLRSMSLTKFMPVIFLTQRDERAAKVRGLEIGADDYITKPFDIDELRLRVQRSIRRATQENLHEPRTGLPTGAMVEEHVNKRRAEGFHELHFYIENFQAYADVYSFMAANDVVAHAAKTIRDAVVEMGTDHDFVGIDGDEFVVMTGLDDIESLETVCKTRFAEQVKTFYTFADVEREGILLNVGEPDERFVGLMTFGVLRPAVQQ